MSISETSLLAEFIYTTRYVDNSCGLPDLHWGRRRADDAFSAFDYLIEKKLAKPDEVYIMGYSNGGTTALVSMTTQEADHSHHFAAAFAVAPGCSPSCSIPHCIRDRLSSLWAIKTMRIIQSGVKN
jgi:dienelactone hydrolase